MKGQNRAVQNFKFQMLWAPKCQNSCSSHTRSILTILQVLQAQNHTGYLEWLELHHNSSGEVGTNKAHLSETWQHIYKKTMWCREINILSSLTALEPTHIDMLVIEWKTAMNRHCIVCVCVCVILPTYVCIRMIKLCSHWKRLQ